MAKSKMLQLENDFKKLTEVHIMQSCSTKTVSCYVWNIKCFLQNVKGRFLNCSQSYGNKLTYNDPIVEKLAEKLLESTTRGVSKQTGRVLNENKKHLWCWHLLLILQIKIKPFSFSHNFLKLQNCSMLLIVTDRLVKYSCHTKWNSPSQLWQQTPISLI